MPEQPSPIDFPSLLRRLFDRPVGTAKNTTPEALFRTAPAAAVATAPAAATAAAVVAAPERISSTPAVAETSRKLFGFLTSRRKHQRLIGLDVGSASIKLIRLEREEGQVKVSGAGVEEFPTHVGEGPEWERAAQEGLANLKRQGLLNAPVILGFHHLNSIVEPLRLAKMPSAELDQAILWEARDRLALNPEETVIRSLVTGESAVEGQSQLDVLLVAAPRAELLSRWNLVHNLGIKVTAIEPVSLASFYSLSIQQLWKPDELVGLLEMGMRYSHLSFIREGSVRYTRSFPIAGDSFTRSIADYCQIDYDEAERLKRRYGISQMALEEDRLETGHESDERVKIAHALGLFMEKIVAEIEQSYRFFAFELGGSDSPRMDRLILSGGGALLKNLGKFLSDRLTVPVVGSDPLRGVSVTPAAERNLKPEWSQRLAVPMGLALRSSE